MTLPETTYKLLRAVRTASGTSEREMIKTVVIQGDGKACGIYYYPRKNRYIAACIRAAGIADLVTLFVFDSTRHKVARHFREGEYDISTNEIKILK